MNASCWIGLMLFAALAPQDEAGEVSTFWVDATDTLLGQTGQWTNRVELADIDGDGRVDVLFANGGDYTEFGDPESSRVFLNRGAGQRFRERTDEILGDTPEAARVIKARDLNGDGHVDIVIGNTFQTRSRLYLGRGNGAFENVSATHLPEGVFSIGDIALGDVDGDGDLDMALADWGPGTNMSNAGGRTQLWLNDGAAKFTNVTETQMPETLVQFSWDLDFVDVNNDMDLDLVVSCKMCNGSKLFLNDGKGTFQDGRGGLPPYTNNYELEPMDLDGDGWIDLVTVNDGQIVAGGGNAHRREHVFQNRRGRGFADVSDAWWPAEHNLGHDDNMVKFLDHDSDGDADFLLASLSGPDRLLINDGEGHLTVATEVFDGPNTPGTLAMGIADLDGDHRMDVVQAQGEHPTAVSERIHLGLGLAPDTAAPHIGVPQIVADPAVEGGLIVRVRVHDSKSPSMPFDWKSVGLRWSKDEHVGMAEFAWFGEYLWSAHLPPVPEGTTFQIVATDAAGNQASNDAARLIPDPPRPERPNRRNR
tara:strand:- start:20088 stop:21689 length:1602 start_codon:yes stop_codon:yes gene_type:complete